MSSESESQRLIYCVYLKKDLPGLKAAPIPGELGKFFLENISQEAWGLWSIEQVKFINENRLKLNTGDDKERLKAHRASFFGLS